MERDVSHHHNEVCMDPFHDRYTILTLPHSFVLGLTNGGFYGEDDKNIFT